MNQLTFRQLTKDDWEDICDWWRVWWRNDHTYEDMLDPKNGFFPANGEGGYIVECDGEKIVAGFLYLTNAKLACFTYMVSKLTYFFRFDVYMKYKITFTYLDCFSN